MTEMRILTVRQPWAWAIIHGGKDVENRVRDIAGEYRGPVAIHVSKGVGSFNEREQALQEVYLHTAEDVRRLIAGGPRNGGHIIGVVDLTDVHLCVGECSPWALPTMQEERRDWWHLRLDNPRALTEPIPYPGALGLRRLDKDISARVMEAAA